MLNNTLIIDIPKIPLSLLRVEGIFSPLKHRLIIISLSFLLLMMIISSSFVIYATFTDRNDFIEKYIILFIPIVMLFFGPIYLINMLAQRKKMPFMKITEKGIEYSEENIIGSQISNYISWQRVTTCLVAIETTGSGSKNPRSYFKFSINNRERQSTPILILISHFKRFTNGKELIRAFLANLINLDRNITFAESLFYQLNLDPENVFELSVKQPAKKAQYRKRNIMDFMFAIAIICLTFPSLIWIVYLDFNALISTFLVLLAIFLFMIPTSILISVMISKYTHTEPPYSYILYQITK